MGEDPPLDVDVVVEDALVLEGPDVPGQLGVLPLLSVLEVSLEVLYIYIYIFYFLLYIFYFCSIDTYSILSPAILIYR